MSNNTTPLNESQDFNSYDSPVAPSETADRDPQRRVKGSTAGGTWVALIIGVLLLIILLTFILQNQEKFDLQLFAWSIQLPIGVGILLSAILGALIMALVGGVRIMQLRRQVKRA
ncbi:LapA family protein [Corynebacterium auriscanis]|uniref:LapA family protein n=1 Tax=Corynebacterium auriscanis TaxID=99807 RepID=UPI002245E008|nr:lipopolysaccharide assembly protein LapA domain-containing protein [Corynebacterium auriscanis]MCX2163047.1 lipopolysaccharide assembly protein LapA domain-containing protein [Corynebacterium auriscanis]